MLNVHDQKYRGEKSAPHPSGVRVCATDARRQAHFPRLSGDQVLMRGDGTSLPLRGMYRGATVFLLAGGPSAKMLNLGLLRRPGIVTMCVNNSWLLHRPQLWVGVDPANRFADTRWKDPTILKMCPMSAKDSKLGTVDGDGKKHISPLWVRDMPNVAYFRRGSFFEPEEFFRSNLVCWGNTNKEPLDAAGVRNQRSVFLAALKLCHYLGFSKVNLVGVDLKMSNDPGEPAYSWGEAKNPGARRSNNNMFQGLCKRLNLLQKYLDEVDGPPFQIQNTNPDSFLRCFPFVSFQEEIDKASEACSQPTAAKGWYS